jgi:hypothetical protein
MAMINPTKFHKAMCFIDDMMFIKLWIFKRKNLIQQMYFNNDRFFQILESNFHLIHVPLKNDGTIKENA